MTSSASSVDARNLELELLDPGAVTLVRLFRHPGGEWQPPDDKYRNLRIDPPDGHKSEYAVLYTGSTLPAVAMECHILRADEHDRYTWAVDLARQYKVVRYAYSAPALFIPIDGRNRQLLGLSGGQRKFKGYSPYQEAALDLFGRFGKLIHGLSWESFHRGQPGRVYAIWHHRKAAMALKEPTPPYGSLEKDNEWVAFLAEYPDIESIVS